MTRDDRRLLFHVAPLSAAAMGLSCIACLVIASLKLDNTYDAWAILGLGAVAGVLQKRSVEKLRVKLGRPGRVGLLSQIYSMIILTAICSIPGLLIGRAIAGMDIWTGI